MRDRANDVVGTGARAGLVRPRTQAAPGVCDGWVRFPRGDDALTLEQRSGFPDGMLAIILAALAPLFAQSHGSSPDKHQSRLSDFEVRQIVLRSIEATERSWAGARSLQIPSVMKTAAWTQAGG